MKIRDFSKLYIAFLIFHLVVVYKPDELLYFISKPLLMVSLLTYFVSRTTSFASGNKWFIITALAFSLTGDVLWIWSNEILFLSGTAAFAVAHVFYISFFLKEKASDRNTMLIGLSLLIAGGLMWILHTFITVPPTLSLPVYGYTILSGLSFVVAVQYAYGQKQPFYLIPLGMLLFMISAFLLMVNKAGEYHKYLQITAVLIYGLAQYIIVAGILKKQKNI